MTFLKPRSLRLTALATALSGLSLAAWATGFRLPDQDAFATARGEAFAATADNPSAIYYNPAGITQLEGHNLRGGVYGLYLQSSYDSPAGGSYDNDRDGHAIPQFFYTYTPEKLPLSFGLGVYSPYGLSSRWPDDSGFRTLATEGKLTYYTINPVVAWKIVPSLSVAAGLTANYNRLDLQQGLVWPTQSYDGFKFKADGWDVGYNLGVMWRPLEQLSFGATFRSATTMDLDGYTEFHNDVAIPGILPVIPTQHTDAQAGFPFPWETVLGVSYRPTPEWNFEFNAEYTGWDRLNTVVVHQAAASPPLLPQDIPIPLNWEGSWYYEFGATRYLGKGWSVSGGYIYNENSVPDANYTPLVADLNRHFISVGTGHKGKHFQWDVAYQFGYGPERTVTGSAPSATGQSADGRYDFLSHALFLTAQWAF